VLNFEIMEAGKMVGTKADIKQRKVVLPGSCFNLANLRKDKQPN